jgi:16S rRNA (cytosine1402-N4)-methyltransferase
MFHHKTVLLDEAVEGLNIKENGTYVDCTLGGAGHSRAILDRLHGGILIGIDQDDRALAAAAERLQSTENQIHLVKSNFSHLGEILDELGIKEVDGVLFDLGVSSPQLDEAERGFSYQHDAPLDMRMDQTGDLTAEIIVNEWDEAEIARILFVYGEEKFARKIARKIIESRNHSPIKTTFQLAELIKEGIPAAARRTGGHPAKRSFQAIRIAVNRELEVYEQAIETAITRLAPKGRVAVITFHSLEDRITKEAFAAHAKSCTCPPDFPICVCGNEAEIRIVNRKPILASESELENNRRSRSAKLRIAEKI